MKAPLTRFGLAIALAMLAAGAQARTDGQKAVAGIGELLRTKDCAGAVKALNAGLQAGYPETALLAGTMFEAGFCVNRNWDKAMGFYTQAHDGGIREGALRLAAGFAAAANGPDTAAALWWAKRAGLDADHCTASLPAPDDAERFVEALRQWRPETLEICNFVVGEMAFIAAEARYPMAGIQREIMGRAELVFTPARAHFKSEARDATGPASSAIADVLVRAISQAGARYRKPEGIPASWTIPFVVLVDTDKNRWW
jgi:TPR repeat protein